MEIVSVILEGLIVLMLGALLVFRPKKETNAKTVLEAESSQELLRLVAGVDQRLGKMMEIRQLTLPWTELLAENGDRGKALEALFAKRQDLRLSLLEELDFISCAQLTALGLLLETSSAQDMEGGRPVSLAG